MGSQLWTLVEIAVFFYTILGARVLYYAGTYFSARAEKEENDYLNDVFYEELCDTESDLDDREKELDNREDGLFEEADKLETLQDKASEQMDRIIEYSKDIVERYKALGVDINAIDPIPTSKSGSGQASTSE